MDWLLSKIFGAEKSTPPEDKWDADIWKAVHEIGRALDGFKLNDVQIILKRVIALYICPLKVQGPKD